MKERYKKLINDVANHFDNRCMIMHEEWLQENNVSIDELDAICAQCHMIIKGYINSSAQLRGQLLANAAVAMVKEGK